MEHGGRSGVRADAADNLSRAVENLWVDLSECLERAHRVYMRWAFVFWLSELIVLGGLMLLVLRMLGQR